MNKMVKNWKNNNLKFRNKITNYLKNNISSWKENVRVSKNLIKVLDKQHKQKIISNIIYNKLFRAYLKDLRYANSMLNTYLSALDILKT